MHIPDLPGLVEPTQPLPLAASFARMSRMFLRESSGEAELCERICEQSSRVVDADCCGVSIRRRGGRLESPAVSHPVAARCDELQVELGEGPCVGSPSADQEHPADQGHWADQGLTGPDHLVHDTLTEARWPRWCAAVAELGVRSLVSVRLPADSLGVRQEPFGALTLYGYEPAAFGELHLLLAQVYATHAGNAIAHLREVDALRQAMASRHAIGLAQGVLVQRYGLGVAQALALLQRYSSQRAIELREAAEQVVAEQVGADTPLHGAPAPAEDDEGRLDLA